MELPDEILAIIREYSKPISLPNWKHLHKFTHINFGIQMFVRSRKNPLCNRTFESWAEVHGVHHCSLCNRCTLY
jgi:hypothetical protein